MGETVTDGPGGEEAHGRRVAGHEHDRVDHQPQLELRPTRANGQPAFGCYLHSRAWGMLVLALSGGQIAELMAFSDPSLVGRFGLPRRI